MKQGKIAEKWLSSVPLAVAAVIGMIAGVILYRLLTDMDQHATFSGPVGMKANTALGFLVCASLLVVAKFNEKIFANMLRWPLAILLLILGLQTLVQYVFGIQLYIDEILVNAPTHEAMTATPGRMAPTTAICFVMFSLAMMIDQRRSSWARGWSRVVLTLLGLIALASLLGYAYGAPALYLGIDGVTAMSLSSAILFLLLSSGAFWLRAEYGITALLVERSVVGAHIRALLPMVVGAPLLVGAAVAAGYGRLYDGQFAIALTALGSLVAAGLIAMVSIVILRRAESELYIKDRALAATTSGVVITDHRHPNEPIIFVNSAFTTITGYPESECIGKNCRFLNVGTSNPPEKMAALRASIKSESGGGFELENKRKDGQLFWNRLSLAPVEDFEGKITHFVGVVDDVTNKRQQASQLEHALADARKANAMRNTFIRLVSHELRTPLNAALTWLRLMEVDDNPETLRKGLNVVAKSVDSQTRLIDDLVDVTRFVASGVRLETEVVDIGKLVRMTVEELRPMIEPDQTLNLAVAENELKAVADPLRLQQIVRNIVTNASKYTPAGGRIDVSVEFNNGHAVLTVTDNGKGLSPEEIGRIFDEFWRAESHQPGLGVGLSIVASLVAAHGGTIETESDGPGQGCTFRVRLPLSGANESSVTRRDDTAETDSVT